MACYYVHSTGIPASRCISEYFYLSAPAMAKGYKIKSSNRSTPEPTFSKVLEESSTSTLLSESVAEPADVQNSPSSTVCSASAESLTSPSNDHQQNHEHDQCRKVPILHHIIVERLDTHSCKNDNTQICWLILFIVFVVKSVVLRYEGDKSGDMFHGEGVAYFQGGHIYKVTNERRD